MTTAPHRTQRSRQKGWRMPAGAVYVGRPSKWGNPWKAEVVDGVGWCCTDTRNGLIIQARDPADAHGPGRLALPHLAARERRRHRPGRPHRAVRQGPLLLVPAAPGVPRGRAPRNRQCLTAAAYVGLSPSTFRGTVAIEVKPIRISDGRIAWLREDLNGWRDRRAGRAQAVIPPAPPRQGHGPMTSSPPRSPPSGLPKGVRAVRARLADGSFTTYWYCRLTNTRLPPPDSPGLDDALHAARHTARTQHEAGSLGHAIQRWEASPEYPDLAKRTQSNRQRYLKALSVPVWAARQVASLQRGELLDVRDAIAAKHGPAAANMFVQSASSLLNWCVERQGLPYNPLLRVKALAGGHFPAWTEAEAQVAIAKFREPQRRAVVLAYHTGLRRGDLLSVQWSAYDGRAIRIQPEKTRRARDGKDLAPLRLPCGPALRAELDAWKAENSRRDKPALTILTSPTGLPWGREALSQAIAREVARLELREGLSLHGFRKLAASRLAEASAATKEIAAALGWESLAHVELYTRAADQERLAEAAVSRLANGLSNAGKRRK